MGVVPVHRRTSAGLLVLLRGVLHRFAHDHRAGAVRAGSAARPTRPTGAHVVVGADHARATGPRRARPAGLGAIVVGGGALDPRSVTLREPPGRPHRGRPTAAPSPAGASSTTAWRSRAHASGSPPTDPTRSGASRWRARRSWTAIEPTTPRPRRRSRRTGGCVRATRVDRRRGAAAGARPLGRCDPQRCRDRVARRGGGGPSNAPEGCRRRGRGAPRSRVGRPRGRVGRPTRSGGPPSLEQLREHCRDALARFKAPRDVRMVTTLPRTANGKVRRSALP